MGSIVEIVPANTITTEFDIHWISISSLSANATYEIVLYQGAASSEVEIGRVRATRAAALTKTLDRPFQDVILAANTRISGAVASSSGNADTIDLSIYYHPY